MTAAEEWLKFANEDLRSAEVLLEEELSTWCAFTRNRPLRNH